MRCCPSVYSKFSLHPSLRGAQRRGNLAWSRRLDSRKDDSDITSLELVPKLYVGMHTPELCSGKQACSTRNATVAVRTWAKHVNAETETRLAIARLRGNDIKSIALIVLAG